MKWNWSAVRRQTMELMFGATAEERHHQSLHCDRRQAYETFMSSASATHRSTTPGLSVPSTAEARRRDHGYAAARKHFGRIPDMFLDIEFYFAITGLGLFDHLVDVLLLPLKLLLPWRRCELRDVITLFVLILTLTSYGIAGLATTQLYPYLYHAVRRTSFIKVVMIFGILDIVDKIFSSFSQDSLEVLYAAIDDEYTYYCARRRQEKPNAAATPTGKAACESGPAYGGDVGSTSAGLNKPPSRWLLVGSAVAACISTSCHSLSLLLHVVTLNVTINAEGSSLLALLVGNNFTELKSVIFKKHTPESLHSVCVLDALERMQYLVFFFVMLLHHMHERFTNFAVADVLIILCVEVGIDFVKHLFVLRFNGIQLSVIRAYSQLALLDLSCEKVLWRLPSLEVVASPSSNNFTTHVEEGTVTLLTPAYGYAPKNVKRSGFDAIAYAALLLWSSGRVAGYLLFKAPLVCVLLVVILILLKLALSTIIYGMCARFTLRTLVVAPPRWPTPAPPPNPLPASSTIPLVASADVRWGVSPISTPPATPTAGTHHSHKGSAASLSSNSRSNPAAARTLIRLTPLLLALLKADRFDLQAGKAKRSY